VLLALLAASSLRILREYERGVVFQLGRFWRVKGPGLVLLIPGIQQMVRIDLRVVVMDVPSQDVISRDNVTLKVNAVLYFRVVDPQKAVIQVENFLAPPASSRRPRCAPCSASTRSTRCCPSASA
jgi:regulator of protease activity HflC (stomatin/prohibitin superfamily)